MKEIDWAQAPEGTTHAFGTGQWRKITDEAVYAWRKDRWARRDDVGPVEWMATYPTAVGGNAQPNPAPKENPLPNGKVWFEHATYWNPEYPEQGGLFFTDTHHYWDGEWLKWYPGSFEWWEKYEGTIKRFPEGGKPQVKQEQPKKPVGWWS